MDLLAPCHRASFDPHSASIKAKWMINLLTAYVVDRRGGNDKAMSGNCCGISMCNTIELFLNKESGRLSSKKPWRKPTEWVSKSEMSVR
jgi:hypothetical protein